MNLGPVKRAVSSLGLLLPSGVRAWIRDKRTEFLPDRQYMKRTAYPALAATRPQRVLSVGVQRYNLSNARIFEGAGCEFWTTDIVPESAKYGIKDRHVVADVKEIDRHFALTYFDLVILNGVFGHGVNDLTSQEQTISAIRKILTPRGALVVGWNQGMSGDPCGLAAIREHFKHGGISGLPERMDFRSSNHTFDFFTVSETSSSVPKT